MADYFDDEVKDETLDEELKEETLDVEAKEEENSAPVNKAEVIRKAVEDNAYLIDIIKAVVNDNYSNEQPKEQEEKPAEKVKTLLDEESEQELELEPELEEEPEDKPVDYFAELEKKAEKKPEDEPISFAPPEKPGTWVHIDNTWFASKQFDTKYEAEKYFQGRVERAYNRRESAARQEISKVADRINGYLENDGKEDNYYNRKLKYISSLLSQYLGALKAAGAELSEESIRTLSSSPQPGELSYKSVKERLSEDVVEYDEYHSVKYYTDQHFEENTDTVFRDGFFGGHDVEKYVIYGVEVGNAVNEIADDIKKNIESNIKFLWPEVLKVAEAFNRALAGEIMAKIKSIDSDVEKSCA